MKWKNYKILTVLFFFLVTSIIIPVSSSYDLNDSKRQSNISEIINGSEEVDSKNLTNKTMSYKPLIERLGIEVEEEIEVRAMSSKQKGRKDIKPFARSNKNLINILDKKEFKEYVEENDEQLPVIIILSKQNLGKVSRKIKGDYKEKIDPKLKEIEKIESKVKLSMTTMKDSNSEEIYSVQLNEKDREDI